MKDIDFLVSAIRYNKNNDNKKHIDRFRVHNNYINSISTPSRWRRDVIIMRIESGKKFYCVYVDKDGDFVKGPKINVVDIDGEKFLQTEISNISKDIIEDVFVL